MRSYRWQKKTKLIFIGTGILLLFSFTLTGFYQSNFFSSTHQPKIDSNFPLSASSTRNVQIFLMGLNQTHTLRGNNFTAFGYTQQALLNGTWVNTRPTCISRSLMGSHTTGQMVIITGRFIPAIHRVL